jgi:hypothetical protein
MADWMDDVSMVVPSPFAPKSRTSNAPCAESAATTNTKIVPLSVLIFCITDA